jgi:hypothetical protein
MVRPKENRIPIVARLRPKDRENLAKRLIDLGFSYPRNGTIEPAWTEFMEAVATSEIILYKKI